MEAYKEVAGENERILATELEIEGVLRAIPQQKPFRFIDRIVELSDEHIVAQYHFKSDEYFYKGHFPGEPVTPGVILVEAMAQAGLVALGIYLLRNKPSGSKLRTFFTECNAEFAHAVYPNSLVTISAEKIYWRRNKLESSVQMTREDGVVVAHGTIAGIGVEIYEDR